MEKLKKIDQLEEEIKELKQRIKSLESWKTEARSSFFADKVEVVEIIQNVTDKDLHSTVENKVIEDSKTFWHDLAIKEGKNDIASLIKLLWQGYCSSDGIEFKIKTEKEVTQVIVSKCPYADMAKQLGMESWGYSFYCMSDYGITEGFNPKINFSRTKTLMQGCDCCDASYQLKE